MILRIFKNTAKFAFLSFCLAVICPDFTLAQPPPAAADRASRETDVFRPEDTVNQQLRTTPSKQAAPEPKKITPSKEEQRFFIKKVLLSGCESFPPESFSEILKQCEDKEVTLTDLENLGSDIEREYLKRGVIAAVFVPAQEIKGQAIELKVVESHMGELQVKDHKYFKKNRIYYYWGIKQDEILRYDKLSRTIQMMNKNPDREVKATLFAGKKPGTTDVLLTPKTRFPAHFTSSYDREGINLTGKSRYTLGIRHNNFLGADDTFISGYSFGQEFSGVYYYHLLPISKTGTSLMYGYSDSQSTPQKQYSIYGFKSKMKTVSFSVRQDVYNKDNYLGEVFAGFDAKDKTVNAVEVGTLNRDRQRIFSTGGNFIHKGFRSITYISPAVYMGIRGLGANGENNPLASRDAKPDFTKFNLSVNHKIILPLKLQGNVRFKTQLASHKLVPQEEYSLGGIDTVRGYPPADFLADNAVNTNVELLIPSTFIPNDLRLPYSKTSLQEDVTWLIFFDQGWGNRRGALSTEKSSKNMLSYGAGLRFRLYDQATLRLEWGFPIADNRSITEAGDSRFHFSVDFQDRLPEEIDYIQQKRREDKAKKIARNLVNEELANPQSPAKAKIERLMKQAEAAHKEKRLAEAKELYMQAKNTVKDLQKQAEDYVLGCLNQEKELTERNKLAEQYYKEGKTQEAKMLWEKNKEEARLTPMVFDIRS